MGRLKQIGIDVEVNGVIERSRRSFSESENDILRRLLLDRPTEIATKSIRTRASSEAQGPSRRRGLWSVEFQGDRHSAPNLKGAYEKLLLLLSEAFPRFLEDFSQEQARSRRFVARNPAHLYLASPELADEFAKPLRDGWFFDTNLSAEQVAKRVRAAARVCGLLYGRDMKILNGLQQI